MIYNIQSLRVIAALSVVYLHVTFVLKLPFSVGSFGVDIFFVVSGFIISYLASQNPDQFFLRRVIRIVPAYWFITFLTYAAVTARPAVFHTTHAYPALLARSLFFMPYDASESTGPLVSIGWTLVYEMYFYAIFAAALIVKRRNVNLIASVSLVALFFAFRAGSDPVLRFYGNSIVLEFVLGMLCFQASPMLSRFNLPAGAVALGVVLALFFLCLAESLNLRAGLPRVIVFGIPALIALMGALFLERRSRLLLAGPKILAISNASYVLFLSHIFVIAGIARLVPTSMPLWARWVIVFPEILLCVGIALFLHEYGEKPLLLWLRGKLLRGKAATISAASAP